MNARKLRFLIALVFLVLSSAAGITRAQGSAVHAATRNPAQMQFGAVPGLPACTSGAVQSGDPSQGAAMVLAKAATGCTVPWHWHTPNEHLMIVSGVVRLETKDAKPVSLRAGGYALMPSRHVHQFHCASECLFYVHSDGALDIHYVDAQGNEMAPAAALKTGTGAAPTKH